MKKFASIDIGGTNVRFALVENSKIKKKIRFKTEQINWTKTLNKIVSLINKHEITHVALCIPGPANYEEGKILSSPNLKGWKNKDIKTFLLDRTNIEKIVFENDANVMALANHHYYKQTQKDVTQFFTISTGFGAGLIINNKVFTGSNHLGQEIARIPLGEKMDDNFHLSKFSAELFVSGTGIALRASKIKKVNMDSKFIFENFESDPELKKIINESILVLAKTIATSIGMLNPNLMVFGGSVSNNNSFFVKEAIKLAKEFCDYNQYKQVKFRFDRLKDNSALIGLNYLINNENK